MWGQETSYREEADIAESREYLQSRISELMQMGILGEDLRTAWLERYDELLSSPLDLNTASQEDLLSLPLLSEFQAYQLILYRHEHKGSITDISDLKNIKGWDKDDFLTYIYPLVCLVPSGKSKIHWNDLLAEGKGQLTMLLRRPFESTEGKQYIGSPEGLSLGYSWQSKEHLSLFVGADKDSYEPWSYKGYKGFDSYHGHVAVRSLSFIRQLILGQYRASWAEGLVLGQSFRLPSLLLGKPSSYRYTASRGTSHYHLSQGISLDVNLGSKTRLSVLGSWLRLDGRIDEEGEYAYALSYADLHRTEREWSKRAKVREHYYGARLGVELGDWTLSAQAIRYNWGGKRLKSALGASYYDALDSLESFANMSLSYLYRSAQGRLVASGELARSSNRGLATSHQLHYTDDRWGRLALALRYISPDYWSYYGHSRTHYAYPHNEMGVSMAFSPDKLWGINFAFEGDWYRSIDVRRRAEREQGASLRLSMEGQIGQKLSWAMRSSYSTSSVGRPRLTANLHLKEQQIKWSKELRATIAHSPTSSSLAYALTARIAYKPSSKSHIWTMMSYHKVDNWLQRIYLYETALAGEYSSTWLMGRGLRLSAGLSHHFSPRLSASLKLSHHEQSAPRPPRASVLSIYLCLRS